SIPDPLRIPVSCEFRDRLLPVGRTGSQRPGFMSDFPATSASLLVRLRDARDTHAWSQFVDVYAPLIYGFARKQGLQDADAADLGLSVASVYLAKSRVMARLKEQIATLREDRQESH